MLRIKAVIQTLFAIVWAHGVSALISDLTGLPLLGVFGCLALLSFIIPATSINTLSLKVLWGAGVVDGRGKLNGWVFSKNRAGAYARTKVSPANPQSSYQLNVRSSFSAFAQLWRSLTNNQRKAWINLAQSVQVSDIFGNPRNISGINLFIRCNQNLTLIGAAPINDAPTFAGVGALSGLTIDPDSSAGTFIVDWTSGNIPAGTRALVYATPNVSPSINYLKNLPRVVTILNSGTSTGVNIFTAYTSRLGALQAGKQVGVYVRLIDATTGEAGLSASAVRPVS